MSVSLDGFVADPDHDLSWIFDHLGEDTTRWMMDFLRETDTQLIGRVNYLEQAAHWPSSTEEIAALLNEAEKIVFSRTLRTVRWRNSRLTQRDPAAEIAELRAKPGKHIFVPGGAGFVRGLTRQGLVDEYRLLLHPYALGAGLALFDTRVPLRLTGRTGFRGGVQALTYVPIRD